MNRYIRYLPVYGCVSTGIIYLGIGTIAILSFLKLKDGGADESSMLAFLNEYVVGKIFIWIILSGTVSFIVWRIYEAITDPYRYGSSTKGKVKRTGIALSTAADVLIVYSAIRILLGVSNIQLDGQPEEERQMVTNLLRQSWGSWVITAVGVLVTITAIVQFQYGITGGYKERIDVARLHPFLKTFIYVLAWIGYFARGIILGIMGFFLIKSGVLESAEYVVNTDKAFDFIGDNVGHVFFILTAVGTIFYGLFMFSLCVGYNIEGSKH